MSQHDADRLASVRGLTEDFLAHHHPVELFAFPRIWNDYLQSLTSSTNVGKSWFPRSGTSAGNVLSFAAERRVEVVAPLVILTAQAVVDEILGRGEQLNVPPIEALREAVESCATAFGVSAQLRNAMSASMPAKLRKLILENLPARENAQPSSRSEVAIYKNGTVTVDGRKTTISPAQAAIVLCEFVRSQRVHWLQGYILFEHWTRRPPQNPYDAFGVVVTKLRSQLRDVGAPVKIEPEKSVGGQNSGWWELTWFDRVDLTGDLIGGHSCVVEARTHLSHSNPEAAARCLMDAYQADSRDTDAERLILELCDSNASAGPPVDTVKQSLFLMQRHITRVKDAIALLVEMEDSIQERWLPDVRRFRDELETERLDLYPILRKATAIVENSIPLSKEEEDYQRLDEITRALRVHTRDHWAVGQLEQNEHLKEIIGSATQQVCRRQHLDPDENLRQELRDTMFTIFVEQMCSGGKPVSSYENLSEFKGAWVTTLARQVADEYF